MRIRYFLILLFLPVILALPASAQEVGIFDELTPIYPDTDPASGVMRFKSHSPRNVMAGVHLLLSGLPENGEVKWQITMDGKPSPFARVYRIHHVPVEQNTGIQSRTEEWDKKENPHVIREAPFRVYEALEPVKDGTQADRTGVLALRLAAPVPLNTDTGIWCYKINLEAGPWKAALYWDLHVYQAQVPVMNSQSPGYTNWFSLDNMAIYHGLEPWSEPFWAMLEQYADLMARGRQNTFWIPWRHFLAFEEGGEVKMDQERLDRYIRIFLRRGFNRIEGGHIARRHKEDWGSPRLNVTLTGTDTASHEGRKEVVSLMMAIQVALGRAGVPEGVVYLQHVTDEPTDKNAASYKALVERVRKVMPGVCIFEATMSRELVGAVDAWCPQVQKYQQNRDFFEARKEAGDTVWVYTCLVPGGPWLNRLLDQERLRPVYMGWALARYDLAGFLHWGFNHYRKDVDPFETSVVPHGDGPPNFLPAGDSHVAYPGKDGPWSGIRFEAHRIGMEDAELLNLLKARDPDRAAAIMDLVFRAFDDYDTEVPAYRAARLELLQALLKE